MFAKDVSAGSLRAFFEKLIIMVATLTGITLVIKKYDMKDPGVRDALKRDKYDSKIYLSVQLAWMFLEFITITCMIVLTGHHWIYKIVITPGLVLLHLYFSIYNAYRIIITSRELAMLPPQEKKNISKFGPIGRYVYGELKVDEDYFSNNTFIVECNGKKISPLFNDKSRANDYMKYLNDIYTNKQELYEDIYTGDIKNKYRVYKKIA